MTMARFARNERFAHESNVPAWLAFIWAVNEVRPKTFDRPTHPETERPGYETEQYPTARVIHGPGDEGVRIVAETDETARAFRQVATRLGIHIA